MSRKTLFIFFVCICSVTWLFAAPPQLRVVQEKRHGRDSAAVMRDNHVIVRFYGEEPGLGGPEKRARIFMARILHLAALGISPDNPRFFAGIEGDQTVLKFHPNVICRIMEAETTVNQTVDVALAREWLGNVRHFLSLLPQDSQWVKEDKKLPVKGLATVFNPLIWSQDFIIAHRSLPIGTRVRVVNLLNKWSLVAEVAEHSRTSENIVVELAPNTAEALGIVNGKPVWVRLEKGG